MSSSRFSSYVWPWAGLLIAGLASVWFRYGWVQPPELAHACDGVTDLGNLSCTFRHGVVIGFNSGGFGYAALFVTALSLLLRSRPLAWLAAALGVFAAVMFCYVAGSVALLIGMLRYLNLQERDYRRAEIAAAP
jgi:hypothetical protein